MKGYIRIGGALVFSIAIVVGALYLRGGTEKVSGGVVVSVAPVRAYIESQDANGNKIPDWKESLSADAFGAVPTPTSLSASTSNSYTPPTTFTGKFSEALFQDYLEGKVAGGGTVDTKSLVTRAVSSVEANTTSKRYSRLEIQVVPDSQEAIRAYGTRVVEITQIYSANNKNEATILKRALEKNDPSILEELKPARKAYEDFIHYSLLMPVPELLVRQHLDLLNAYEAILSDIKAMQVAFDDPLLSLARVNAYQNDVLSLYTAYKNIGDVLTKEGITYANDEPGAFFYLFDV